MLYRALQANPESFFYATYTGWTHPVATTIEVMYNDTPEVLLDINLNADYRLRLAPRNSTEQALHLAWNPELPARVVGKRITGFRFGESDNLPFLELLLHTHRSRLNVTAVDTSLQLPVVWEVTESHEGLWHACRPRTSGRTHISPAVALLT